LLPLAVVIVFPAIARTPTRYAREMAAAKAITTIHTAETQYLSKYGQYAASLAQLGPNGAGLIDKHLASGHQRGFGFVLRPTQAGYVVFAKPVGLASHASHVFYSDQNMIIHQLDGTEPAIVIDPILGDPVHVTPGRA
jgi:hypothetical protein